MSRNWGVTEAAETKKQSLNAKAHKHEVKRLVASLAQSEQTLPARGWEVLCADFMSDVRDTAAIDADSVTKLKTVCHGFGRTLGAQRNSFEVWCSTPSV